MKIKKLLKKIYFKIPHSNIFMFHHVSKEPKIKNSNCVLETSDFKNFVDKHNNYVCIYEIIDHCFTYNKISITFDDGLADVYSIAYPFLKNKNIPFTVFILTEMLDTPGYISTEQLLELSNDPLVTIGLHGTFHRVLTKCIDEEQDDEIYYGKLKLEKLINKKIDIFAYSHGQYDSKIINKVRKAGFKYAFSVREKPLNIFELVKSYELPRYNIDSNSINNKNWI